MYHLRGVFLAVWVLELAAWALGMAVSVAVLAAWVLGVEVQVMQLELPGPKVALAAPTHPWSGKKEAGTIHSVKHRS